MKDNSTFFAFKINELSFKKICPARLENVDELREKLQLLYQLLCRLFSREQSISAKINFKFLRNEF